MTPLLRLERDFRVPAANQQCLWAVVGLLVKPTIAYACRYPSGEIFRTRVRFPPSPPDLKNLSFETGFFGRARLLIRPLA